MVICVLADRSTSTIKSCCPDLPVFLHRKMQQRLVINTRTRSHAQGFDSFSNRWDFASAFLHEGRSWTCDFGLLFFLTLREVTFSKEEGVSLV